MVPFPKGLVLDNPNNYGILKTEAVFGFHSPESNDEFFNVGYNLTKYTEPVKWMLTPIKLEKRGIDGLPTFNFENGANGKETQFQKTLKRKSKRTGKGKKCVIVNKDKRMRKRRKSRSKITKMVMPLLLGLMAAKSILVPVALKTLAFISAKGFLMGFFSTILASILSLKGMFDNSHRYQDRKDEKTQVEIIQVPTPTKDEHYYDEDSYYRREHLIPLIPQSGTLVNHLPNE